MFDSYGAYISLAVVIQQGIFIEFPTLGDFSITERQSSFGLATAAASNPLFEGGLAFPGGSTSQQILNANIFVYAFPMDAVTFTNQLPVVALLWGSVYQPGKPGEGDHKGPPITEVNT